MCMPSEQGDALSEAIHALYYLPESYKLVVLSDMSVSEDVKTAIMKDISVMDRIHFADNTEKAAEAAPFEHADVTVGYIADSTLALESSTQQSVVIPARSPEAFASAVLGIARARARK